MTMRLSSTVMEIYVKKNWSVYIQCKGDIVVVVIKQHKSQFKNSNFTTTQSAKFFLTFCPKFLQISTNESYRSVDLSGSVHVFIG